MSEIKKEVVDLTELKKKVCGPFQKMLGLSTATELYGTKHQQPKFIVNMGEKCYTDNRAIVLGLNHSAFQWCQDKDDLYENADYIKGHEIQHIKSTTEKAWQYALKRGCEVIIEKACADNGVRLRLVSDRDYDKALALLRDKGIYLNMDAVMTIVHFITNSIEDGRIEAIRAYENEVFKKQMVHIRLLNWKLTWIGQPQKPGGKPEKIKAVCDMTANEKLTVVLNQILSLATCSVYEKGFAKAYFGTELQERMEEIIPHIAAGVTAKRCRYMAEEAIKVCGILADMIVDAAKFDTEFIKQIEWIKASLKDLGLFEPKTKEENEEGSNTEGKSPFGQSDLYIILPDDEYDELMEKEREENPDEEDGTTIHVRREHPKPEEPEPESETQNPAPGTGQQGETQQGSQGSESGQESSEGDGQEGNGNGAGGSGEGNGTSSGKGDSENGSIDKGNMLGEGGDTVGDASESSTGAGSGNGASGKSSKGKNSSAGTEACGSNDVSSTPDDIEAQIEAQMKEAAAEAAGMAHDNAETAEKTIERQEKVQKMDEDVKEPVTPTDESIVQRVNEACGMGRDYQLIELERKYEVNTLLPPELVKEKETLAKKLESHLHEAKRKFRRRIMSGKLDSSRTAMLAANEINVFKEQKVSNGVKACAELLVDNSGSMGYGRGSKREYACKALAKIEMVFAKYFPIKIFAFDANGGAVIHEIIKGWNEHFSRSAAYNFLEKGRYGGGNFDEYSIRIATADILSRPEKKKLMVVLSDGLPCYTGPEDVKEAIAQARAKGIKVIGIYFSDEEDAETEKTFKDMYSQKDYIITSPEQIEKELVQILKKFFY